MTTVKLTLSSSNTTEGSANGAFTIKLNSPAPAGGLLIKFNTLGSGALLNTDFTFLAGTNISNLTANSFLIKAGATEASLNVHALTDKLVEGDEKVNLNITNLNLSSDTPSSTASFATAIDYATGSGSDFVTTGDFNNDGKLDLVVANGASDSLSVLLRNATNTGFDEKIDYATGSLPISVCTGDFNNDDKLDLAVANMISNTVSVLLRNASNTGFEAKVDYPTGSSPWSVSSSDFNKDGKLDLVTADYLSGYISVRMGNGDGTLKSATTYTMGSDMYSVAVADINGDGKGDIITTNGSNGENANNISIRLGNGDGTFSNESTYELGLNTVGIASGDFNGDGKSDLAVTNTGDNTVSVLLRNVMNTGFDTKVDYTVGLYPCAVSTGDFNNDGKLDLAVANNGSDIISVLLRNTTNTGFDTKVDYLMGSWSNSVTTGDFNNDGKLDLAVANNDAVSVLLNTTNNLSQNLTITDANINHPPTGTVTITGDVQQGKTLTAHNTLADSDGLGTIHYQWLADSYNIGNATNSNYLLTSNEIGKTITVTASYTDGQSTIETVSSLSTAIIGIEKHGDDNNNTLTGSFGNDLLYGEAGNDLLIANYGNDTLNGNAGNDALLGDNGNDVLNGGDGIDWAYYWNATSAVNVNLNVTIAQNTKGAGTDTLTAIENINGSHFDDVLTGNALDNVLYANNGNDNLNGNAGNDALLGDNGNDVLNGGDGIDWAHYYTASTAVNVNLNLTTPQNTNGSGTDTLNSIENLNGGAFNDALTGNSLANKLYGNNGNDTLNGNAGNDALLGGNGNDVLNGGNGIDWGYYYTASSKVNVNLNITTTQNTLGAGIDTLISIENLNGSAFNDVLTGNNLNNLLYGNNGNDTLNGGGGNDVLKGGDGKDAFILNAPLTTNLDKILDFSVSNDSLQLNHVIFNQLTTGSLDSSNFKTGTAAADTNDYLIYNPTNGALFYDADANGVNKAQPIAILGTHLALSNSDFLVI